MSAVLTGQLGSIGLGLLSFRVYFCVFLTRVSFYRVTIHTCV